MDKASSFPQELDRRIQEGQQHGVSEEQLVKGLVSLGNLMEHFIKPDTPEEALMIKMWDIAAPQEKETIASLIIRLGKENVH